MNEHIWFDAIGWLGATLLLVAYAMISSRKIRGRLQLPYQLAQHHRQRFSWSSNTIFYRAYPFFVCELDLGRDSCFFDYNATSIRISERCYQRLDIAPYAQGEFERHVAGEGANNRRRESLNGS